MFFHVFPICHLSHSSVICSLDLQEGAETQSLVFSIPNFLAKAEGWVDLYICVRMFYCNILYFFYLLIYFFYLLIYLFIYLLTFIYLFIYLHLFIYLFIYLVVYMMIYDNQRYIYIYVCVCSFASTKNKTIDLYSCPVTNGSPCHSWGNFRDVCGGAGWRGLLTAFLGTNFFDAEDFSVQRCSPDDAPELCLLVHNLSKPQQLYSLARRRPMAQRPRRANALTNGPQALHTRRSMIWVWYGLVPEDLGGKRTQFWWMIVTCKVIPCSDGYRGGDPAFIPCEKPWWMRTPYDAFMG